MVIKLVTDKDERRDSGRHQIHSLMPIKMHVADTQELFPCRIDDVSSEGLGILAKRRLDPGTAVVFETLGRSYRFIVAWCRDAERREYRCGLTLIEEGVNLETLFSGFLGTRIGG